MVAPHLQGRALAIAMVGTPVALSLGVPLGTWLGKSVGWRATFAAMSVLTLGLVAWVLAKVPDYPGQASARRQPLRAVLLTPGVRPVLAVVFTWMLAHNVLYTYIAPFLAPARMTDQVSSVLFIFGAAALAGIAATARAIDRHLRGAVRSSLAAFALTALAYALWPHSQGVILAGAALWGFSFGGAATLLQTALADAAEDGADVALSMNVVTWNAAIAGGGVTGGVLLDRFGSASFPCIVLVLTLAAFCIATACRVHGFPAGPRRSANGPAMH
jgi:predicted MFS family arabinose efflux permease